MGDTKIKTLDALTSNIGNILFIEDMRSYYDDKSMYESISIIKEFVELNPGKIHVVYADYDLLDKIESSQESPPPYEKSTLYNLI